MTPFRLNDTLPTGLAALLLLFAVGFASAQNHVPYAVMANGGGESSNSSYHLYDTIGQPVIGTMVQGTSVHEAGYQYVTRAYVFDIVAVAITSFTATFANGTVRLGWAIGDADGLEGFHIYRSSAPDESFERINDALLPVSRGFNYTDAVVEPGQSYWYRLGAVDRDGEFFSYPVEVEIPSAATTVYPNFPNPFNPTTTLSFYLAETSAVAITIYDARGRVVRRLLDETRGFGSHNVEWDAMDDRGNAVGSGVYFYKLQAGDEVFTRKLTLLK